MPNCEDCGCKLRNGICGNCQEELAIATFQSEDIDFPLSDNFKNKIEEQKEFIANRGIK
jgi:hypothetical protein